MAKKKTTPDSNYFRANWRPDSYNEEKREIDVVFATDTPVLRYSWYREEYYQERLDMEGADLSRATRSGLPVLDNHGTWGGVGQIIGRAENIRKENGVWVATVRFANDPNLDQLIKNIRDGIITDVSFGYRVNKVEVQAREEGQEYRTYLVKSWTPYEISFVTVPADPRAGVRSEDGQNDLDIPALLGEERAQPENKPNGNNNLQHIMKREEMIALLKQRGITVADDISDDKLKEELARALNTPVQDAAAIQTAVETERNRTAEINDLVRKMSLPNELAVRLIKEGKTIDEARAEAVEEYAKQDPNKIHSRQAHVGNDREAQMRMDATTASLLQRGAPELLRGEKPVYSNDVLNEARNYRHMTLLDIAKDSLIRSGVDIAGMNPMQIVGRAFTSSTSDFPVLLEGANRMTLLAAYNIQADTWRRFCAVGSVSDFREYKRLRMGTFTDLDEVHENGEYKNKKITDADYEKVQIGTKGNIINVTRKMIINDDLGAFLRLSTMLGRAAARSVENDVYKMFAENSGLGPTLADGKALFHADHNNTVTAAAPTTTVIDGMRQKMAMQKDKDGNDFLDIRPDIALAPLSLGSTLRTLNDAQWDPNATNKLQMPNVVRGLFRDVVDTPRLTGTAYYMFANPGEEPVFEVNFLNGVQEPYMEAEEGFTVDGVQWKIRLDYGTDAVGYRGVVKNAGA